MPIANRLIQALTLTLFAASLAMTMDAAHSAANADDDDVKRTVTVVATGEVTAEPDLVSLTTGVVTEARDAQAAVAENSDRMRNVIDGLKALGIDEKDMRTTDFNIGPRYGRPKNGAASIEGFQVRNRLLVLVRDQKKLGDVLARAVDLGANDFGGLSFIVSEADSLADEARTKAVQNARRKAALYAEAAGAKLGDVISITEQGGVAPRPVAMAREQMSVQAVPVEGGTSQLDVTVRVVWALDD